MTDKQAYVMNSELIRIKVNGTFNSLSLRFCEYCNTCNNHVHLITDYYLLLSIQH